MSECRRCEGSGRIPAGSFGSYYRDGERYDPPGEEACEACDGTGAEATHPAGSSLEICQKQRDEMREERDAALAEVERLRSILDGSYFLSIEEINTLPEAQGWWSAADVHSGRIVKLIRAAHRAAIAKAVGGIGA